MRNCKHRCTTYQEKAIAVLLSLVLVWIASPSPSACDGFSLPSSPPRALEPRLLSAAPSIQRCVSLQSRRVSPSNFKPTCLWSSFSAPGGTNATIALPIPSLQRSISTLGSTRSALRAPLQRIFPSRSSAQDLTLFASCLAFGTAWADVAVYCKFKTFATMMTGNLLWLAQALVEGRARTAVYYASVVMSYLLGVALWRKHQRNWSLATCGGMVAGLMAASEAASSAGRFVPMLLLSLAFGLINSVGTDVTGMLTFVVTGHMTKLTHQVQDGSWRTSPDFRKQAWVLLSFLLGGAWACAIRKVAWGKYLLRQELTWLGLVFAFVMVGKDAHSLGGRAWWNQDDGSACELDDDGEICEFEDERTA